jgi:ribosome-dependent ATPase
LGFADLARYIGLLALFIPSLTGVSLLLLSKQEK